MAFDSPGGASVARVASIAQNRAAIGSLHQRQSVASKAPERRWARRKPTFTSAMLVSAKLPEAINCVVRDTSSTGALIELRSLPNKPAIDVDELPHQMTLIIPSMHERSEVVCVVMWRRGRQIGVRYASQFRSTPVQKAKAPAIKPKKR
jgi:hypothetical protein